MLVTSTIKGKRTEYFNWISFNVLQMFYLYTIWIHRSKRSNIYTFITTYKYVLLCTYICVRNDWLLIFLKFIIIVIFSAFFLFKLIFSKPHTYANTNIKPLKQFNQQTYSHTVWVSCNILTQLLLVTDCHTATSFCSSDDDDAFVQGIQIYKIIPKKWGKK